MSEETEIVQSETKFQKLKIVCEELWDGYWDEFKIITSWWGKVGWAFSPIWLPILVIGLIGGLFSYQVILTRHLFSKGTLVESIDNPNELYIIIKLVFDIDDRFGFMCIAYSVSEMTEFQVPLIKLRRAKVK